MRFIKLLRKPLPLATLALIVIAGGVMLFGLDELGTAPAGEDLQRLQQSPQFDAEHGRFDNPLPGVLETLNNVSSDWASMFKWFFVKEERTPSEAMPQVHPNMETFTNGDGRARCIWFGHSSLLLRMSGKNILIDPVFSGNASPIPFTVKRFQQPVLTLEQLPVIDYIVISHDHYDHLDLATVRFFRNRQAQFIVPLGVGSHLRGWGIPADRIRELDWWESERRGELEFIATPARHFSGRSFGARNNTLWASWIIRNGAQNIFFSGDSGYGPHFREIGEKYGPFDAALIETGQYNTRWQAVHLMPDEAAQAYFDLKARMFLPIHWGMFELSMHTWYQPAMEIRALAQAQGITLATPKLGEIVTLDGTPQGSAWWEPWVDPSRPSEWYARKVN